MSVLTRPRAPMIEDAIRLGSTWCTARRVDGGPAFGHGVRVALVIDKYFPDAPLTWAATALVHDAPEFAPREEVDAVITAALGPQVRGYVWGLWNEHEVYEVCDRHPELADARVAELASDDAALLRLMACDQLVSFTNLQRRLKRAVMAGQTDNEFWAARTNLLDRMPYFRRFQAAARPYTPPTMRDQWEYHLALLPRGHPSLSASRS